MNDSFEKINILGLERSKLREILSESLDLTPYRAKQLFSWLYRKKVTDFNLMTDISKSLRNELCSRFYISRLKIITHEESSDGSRKYLFSLDDGSEVESVLIKQPTRFTLCISSQVGCAIGCKFCRTAQMGLKRNLSAAEIIGQVIAVQEDVKLRDDRGGEDGREAFQNIVFMGMGEPLHNKNSVISAVKVLNDELGLNFSGRKITVSTSGLVPAIKEFGLSGARANLAISLNATTDEVRSEIMPINNRWPLKDLIQTLREYPLRPHRRITFEYVMLGDINDSDDDIQRLPQLLKGIPAKINLIPYNTNAGLGFKQPSTERVYYWQKRLLEMGLNSTIRWSKGNDISAACGQLATKSEMERRRKIAA
ncbi:MAG TPA: 23S rRNA (adenine(2503)-C(2))-methyltransferase RlmN [Oligoflexia bacterium]|nr:23S rRNA (adenine(2503)-C(2))-methyltransferase RlmN [Oligoflexia bacterium]HMP47957.1 23S rRNA (adenine(2503)-C(2))-methyltransferase RlmN [Oligoflexia bacterium]